MPGKITQEPVSFPVFILDSRGILLVCLLQTSLFSLKKKKKKEWTSLKYMQNQHANIWLQTQEWWKKLKGKNECSIIKIAK